VYPNEPGEVAITCTCIAVCDGVDVNIKGRGVEKERLCVCVSVGGTWCGELPWAIMEEGGPCSKLIHGAFTCVLHDCTCIF
jgi:hypothetical protein